MKIVLFYQTENNSDGLLDLLFLKRIPNSIYTTKINKYIKTQSLYPLKILCRMNSNHTGPLAIIHRTGRNAGKQSYLKDRNNNIIYRYQGNWINSDWNEQKHSVEGECFIKIYINNDNSSTILLKELCEFQSKSYQSSSNISYITNDFVINIFNTIINKNNI